MVFGVETASSRAHQSSIRSGQGNGARFTPSGQPGRYVSPRIFRLKRPKHLAEPNTVRLPPASFRYEPVK